MDTKDRKRRTSQQKRPARDRQRSAPAKRAPESDARARRKQQAARRRQVSAQPQKRVVRAPREEIPAVVYTAPKPLRRGTFALKLVSMAAVVLAVLMGLSVFFRVETVMVAGAEKYTPWMVREASGISEGDSLLGISEPRVASRIIENLPYVDDVKISINLPGTVNIEITELQVVYAAQADDGSWWLVSSGGRAVEQITSAAAGSYTRVTGLKLDSPVKDETVHAAADTPAAATTPEDETVVTNPLPVEEQTIADEKLQALLTILASLEENRIIGEVSVIDMTDEKDIRLEFGELLVVRLGDGQRLDYKITYMASALQQLDERVSGELDLTLEYTEEALFTPAD